jgi:DNA invertase Pin-like site-specific DNA recombinase
VYVLAEEERTRILERANEGRVAAIKRGTRLGRKSKLAVAEVRAG